jgi:hypothetical protein
MELLRRQLGKTIDTCFLHQHIKRLATSQMHVLIKEVPLSLLSLW